MPMTNAEVEVKEVADVVREKIDEWVKAGIPCEIVLDRVDTYLSGLGDGIDFCDDMRRCEQEAAASVIAKADQYDARIDAGFAAHE